jgi:TPR repeat protein
MQFCYRLGVIMLCLTSAGLTQDRRLAVSGGVGRRMALVVGNDSYAATPLVNAVRDARAIHDALQKVRFSSTIVTNATREMFERAVEEFIVRIQPGDAVLFYYSGHGVQVDGENYLIPIDFAGNDPVTLKYRTVRVSELQDRLEARGARVRILILDACRDSPFRGTRSAGGGLAPLNADGALIAYATAPGSTASDNAVGSNGLFTTHLLRALATPGLNVSELFRHVRLAVRNASGGRQVPWVSDGLVGDFFFVADVPASPAPPPALNSPGTSTLNLPAALADAQRKCDAGDFGECNNLGYAFNHGKGIAVDNLRAAALYQRACDGGDAYGCRNLGILYEYGKGVTKDTRKSAVLYDRACTAGYADGCFNLAMSYDSAVGVPKDTARAAALLQRACDGGNVSGCRTLAFKYLSGEGVAKDVNRFHALLQQSCDRADGFSCRVLGSRYDNGWDVPKDKDRARALYAKACELKDEKGCEALKKVQPPQGRG